MIRTDCCEEMEEEAFRAIMVPAGNKVKKYFIENHLYDYVAFYLATHFNMDAMWQCQMRQEVNSAICSLSEFDFCNLDYERLKKLLKEKHGLLVTNENPFSIEILPKRN